MSIRVFITGMGIVSPLGNSIDENWKHVLDKKNLFTPHSIQKGRNKKTDEYYIGKVDIGSEQNRYSTMAENALIQAMNASHICPDKMPGRYALVIGSSLGSSEYMFQSIKNRYNELNFEEIFPETLAHNLAEKYSVNSLVTVVNSACSSSTHAIGKAYRLIKNDLVDCVYVIGVDSGLSDIGLTSFGSLGVLSTERNMRPFDVRHNGFILSEGAGAVVLQREDFAHKYNLDSYGEIIGYGASCDAYHIVAPDPSGQGAVLAMKRAIEDAGIHPEDIDYINCHGTGTKLNDESEYIAMESVFSHEIFASSTKSVTGHLLGACGIVETIFSCLALEHNLMPGTANLTDPIKKGLVRILDKDFKREIRIAMNNTFAFGGQNASLIIKKQEAYFE